MRFVGSFVAACLVAIGLFVLMLGMVSPPRNEAPDEPVTIANFVRVDGRNEDSAPRSRQRAPEPPKPETLQPPKPPTPQPAMADANLPKLDLQLPTLATGLAVNAAPTPSLAGLNAAPAPRPAPPSEAAPAGGQPGGPEQEVVPLNDVRPEYPKRALDRGIEGHITLAFTITPQGRVENIRVLDAAPANVFDREARRAASRWRFAPRTENGLAVAREATKTLHFRLKGGR